MATGLLGGHSGAYLGDLMDADGICHRFTPIAGESRTCIALLHDGNQTEFLESGPTVSADELAAFTDNYRDLVADADCVTMLGSLPRASTPTTTPSLCASPPRPASRCSSTPREPPSTRRSPPP